MDRTCGAPDASQFAEGLDDKRYARYGAIDKDGICMVGECLNNGSIMVNKESPTDTSSNIGGDFGSQGSGLAALSQMEYKYSGMSYKSSAPSYVDKVTITSNENEQFLIKVMVRQVRRPEVGDKFASRHWQKGVCGRPCFRTVCYLHTGRKSLPLCAACGKRGTSSRTGYYQEISTGCRWRAQHAARRLKAEADMDRYIGALIDIFNASLPCPPPVPAAGATSAKFI